MILPATAKATDGVCMACKQGIRKNLDSTKKYYEEQRKPDPVRDYWKVLVHRVHHTPEGFYGLSPTERTYYAVCLFEGEIYNGGVHQFFYNSSGNFYSEVIAGLQELGAIKSLELLLLAKQVLFSDVDLPAATAERREILPWWPKDKTAPTPAWSVELDSIDGKFYADPDKLGERLRYYALYHKLIPEI